MGNSPKKTLTLRDISLDMLAIILGVASVSLFLNIISRFLIVGPDLLSTILIVLQAVLGYSAIDSQFELLLNKLYQIIKTPFLKRAGFRLVRVFFLSGVLLLNVLLFFQLPNFSRFYNERGIKEYTSNNLIGAEENFIRAQNLNPSYYKASYNLGVLYEDLDKTNLAVENYQKAIAGGLVEPYNNLARLYILDGKPDKAIWLLHRGLKLAEGNEEITYYLLKNLGWATYVQGINYEEAENVLLRAGEINPAGIEIHCILAQVYDAVERTEDAYTQWETCLKNLTPQFPEEFQWLNTAKNILQ